MTGEEKAWKTLLDLKIEDVSKRADVTYNENEASYILRSFGMDFSVCLPEKEIKVIESKESLTGWGRRPLSYFISHSFLWYLINAKDIPLSGRLIRTEDVRGGQHFFRGTHLIPLERLAEKYKNSKQGFIERGSPLGARILDMADASIELLPLPKVPVTLILWMEDEEFPARADLLFDSTCEIHLPLDIIWSVAMMSVLVME